MRVNKVSLGLFLLELLQLQAAHKAGHVVFQKELSIHQILHFLGKRREIILMLL